MTDDIKTLAQYEAAIARAEASFITKGDALSSIRDAALFEKASGSDEAWTFERYCAEKWDYDRSYAYRLINGSRVAKAAKQIGYTLNEGQARELSDLHNDPDELSEILSLAKESAGDGKLTARIIKGVRKARARLIAGEPETPVDPASVQQKTVDPDSGENWPTVIRRVTRLVNGYVADIPQEYQAAFATVLEKAARKSRNKAQRG